MDSTPRFTVLNPESCAGCGLCCYGVGTPPLAYLYRTGHSQYLYRPPDLPLARIWELEQYAAAVNAGGPALPHCLWLDPETGGCRHYAWRPPPCRNYALGCPECLNERRPYVVPRV